MVQGNRLQAELPPGPAGVSEDLAPSAPAVEPGPGRPEALRVLIRQWSR